MRVTTYSTPRAIRGVVLFPHKSCTSSLGTETPSGDDGARHPSNVSLDSGRILSAAAAVPALK